MVLSAPSTTSCSFAYVTRSQTLFHHLLISDFFLPLFATSRSPSSRVMQPRPLPRVPPGL